MTNTEGSVSSGCLTNTTGRLLRQTFILHTLEAELRSGAGRLVPPGASLLGM